MRLLTTTYACHWWAQAREMPYLLPLPMIAELTGAPHKPSGIRPQRRRPGSGTKPEPKEALIPKWELTPELRGSSKKHCTRGSAIVAMSTSSQWTTQPPPPPTPPPQKQTKKLRSFCTMFSIPEKRKKGEIFQEFFHRFLTDTSCNFYHIFTKLCRIWNNFRHSQALSLSRSLSLSHREKGSS